MSIVCDPGSRSGHANHSLVKQLYGALKLAPQLPTDELKVTLTVCPLAKMPDDPEQLAVPVPPESVPLHALEPGGFESNEASKPYPAPVK